MYNIHPIFVHFPIAFLLAYSLIAILPLSRWMPSISWKSISTFLLFFGFLGALVASSTGEIAEEIARPSRSLLEMHSFFAGLSTWLYGLLCAGEIIPFFIDKFGYIFEKLPKLFSIIISLKNLLTNKSFVVVFSVLGLVAISVTGLLGGVMVYGLSADPLASLVVSLLGINI